MGLYKRGRTWWMSYSVDGKLVRQSTKMTSKKKAEPIWAAVVQSMATGQYEGPGTRPDKIPCPPFDLAVDSYLERRESEGKAPRSYQYLDGLWRETFKGRDLATIGSDEIEATLRAEQESRGWANASRNRALAQLSGFLSYCYARRWIDAHPTDKGRVAKLAEDNERERWLRTHELEAIVKACPDWLRPIVRFSAMSGMRLGEICGLTRASFERDDHGRAYVATFKTKNGRPLFWPLEGDALALVEDQIGKAPFLGSPLFGGPTGGNARSSIRRYFKAAVRKAAEDNPDLRLEWGEGRNGITWHTLRHTMASLGLNAGLSTDEIAEMGNWKDLRMVRRYARFSNERLRRSVAKVAGIVGAGVSHNFTLDRKPNDRSIAATEKA